ncbi:MAG: hypothetical protein JW810_13365, partial [Sedimentisphaerales bacterium]|nr:hypothetical protein [Sedimentisphaerales bacterium]
MTKQTKLSPRRAEVLSLLAFGLHLLFFFLTFYLSQRANTLAGKIEAWHFLGGTLIWLILCLLFRQRRLAEDERLDAEQYQRLRQEGKDTSVFEGTLVADSLHLAQRRLNWMEKYLQGLFAIILSLYLLGIGYWLYRSLRAAGSVALAAHDVILETAALMAVLALVSFLFSRYAVGMSQHRTWRPLRAGGSYLLSNALACFVLAILLLVADAGYPAAERILSYVLVVTLVLLGVEVLLNFVLDAFRPRVKGQYHRAAYESRLLGLFSEPGGILRTFAHAMDYQFGFKVSETWFYRLLEKAVVPLLACQAVALYCLSCFAVVPAGHVGVLERWGRPVNVSSPFDSGLHLKLPWPVDSVRTFPVDNIQILEIGFERGEKEYDSQTPILWTVKHWQDEPPFMVAISDPNRLYQGALETARPAGRPGSVSGQNNFDLLVVPLIIHYRIADVAAYEYDRRTSHIDPVAILQAVCYRQAL